MSNRFRTAYGPKVRSSISFPPGEGRTKQSFLDECDINVILARFQATGVADFASKGPGRYMDVSGADFYGAMNVIADAKSMFMELPAEVRLEFGNDPGKFLDFCQDPANAEKMVQMGLSKAPEGAAKAPPAQGQGGGSTPPTPSAPSASTAVPAETAKPIPST